MNGWLAFAATMWGVSTILNIATGQYWLAFLTAVICVKDLQIGRFMWEQANS